jgi:hypothetical protein
MSPQRAGHPTLVGIVSDILDEVPVQLARDALNRSSMLTIERRQNQDLAEHRGGRRINDTPDQFRPVMNNSAASSFMFKIDQDTN